MTAAVYIRKSREDKNKPSHRLTVQREQLPTHARAQGWRVQVYDDGHASAAKGKTEDLRQRSRLEADVRAGRVQVILVIELSRLSRDDTLEDYLSWLNLCVEHGVKLATPSRMLDPQQHSDWMLLLMEGGFSSVEMKVLQGRMAEGRREAFRAGKYLSGNPPAPYVYDKNLGGLTVDPDLLKQMQHVWQLAEQYSARSISEQTGMPVITVRRAIADGRLLFNQGLRGDPDNGDLIQGQWPPVMDADQAERIRAGRRKGTSGSGYRRRNAAGLLSNLDLFYCGYCGKTARAWKASRPRKDGSLIDYYGCTAKDTRRSCHNSRMIPQALIDDRVLVNIFGTLALGDDLSTWWRASQAEDTTDEQLADIDREERDTIEQKRRLVTAITEGIIDFADAKEKRGQIEATLGGLKKRREQLASQRRSAPNWGAIAITRAEFELLDFEDQRDLIAAVVETIRFFANYLLIEYRFPRKANGDRLARIHLPPAKTKIAQKKGSTLQIAKPRD
jgi:DNA invertase Pin-like site-specific DNA recombinase